jgi:hypothetical protein
MADTAWMVHLGGWVHNLKAGPLLPELNYTSSAAA